MQFKRFTDYSIRVLIFLAVKKEKTLISEISEAFDLSQNHMMKVVHNLSLLGYLNTVRGKNGGLYLAKKPEDILLGSLIEDLETDLALVECFNPETDQCTISPACRLKGILNKARLAFINELNRYTLKDITRNKTELQSLILN